MNARETLKLVVGSIAVYAIMAACSARRGGQDFATGDGGSGSGGSGGSGSGSSGGLGDALTDPVGAANADPNQSGSRLKAKYHAGSDGTKSFIGWHDSQRNEDCGFTIAGDGTPRCLPSGAFSGGFFSDSGCTQPAAEWSTACSAAPAYATNTTACNGGTHVYALGSVVGTLYSGSPSACNALPSGVAGYTFYTLGSEVSPSSFVSATVQVEP